MNMKHPLEEFGINEQVKILETGNIGYDNLRYVLYKTLDQSGAQAKYLLKLIGYMTIDDFDNQDARDIDIKPLSWIVPTDMINKLGVKTIPFYLPANVRLKDISVWPDDLNGNAVRLLYVNLLNDESSYRSL